MKNHHGQALEKIIRSNGYNMSEAARELKIDRRTFYNWFKKKTLRDDVILKLDVALRHDFSAEFPEVYTRAVKAKKEDVETVEKESPELSEDALKIINWRDKYIELLEKHTDLLSRNLFKNEEKKQI